ncbi:MAG: peptide chain release factor N(5)-glutamine methyltransferase [Eubacteriales bacterium]|nr:peptide chain release factor N(5)-glutamine methyltransferase [Eubacteriales bacterium]
MPNDVTIAQAIEETTQTLLPVAGDREEAACQARAILCEALGTDLLGLLLRKDEPFPDRCRAATAQMVLKRLDSEPLQYIFGEWDFMGLTFKLGRGVLIPRQDTETLCEHALILAGQRGYKTGLDVCCGSGCIGIALAYRGGLKVVLADIAPDALRYAMENAHLNKVNAQVMQSDMFKRVSGKFDMIFCNPPYIASGDLASLQREVKKEPLIALDGGEDGMDFYRRIAAEYKAYLNDGGVMLLEVGKGQARDVLSMFETGYTVQDLCGVERVVVVENGYAAREDK